MNWFTLTRRWFCTLSRERYISNEPEEDIGDGIMKGLSSGSFQMLIVLSFVVIPVIFSVDILLGLVKLIIIIFQVLILISSPKIHLLKNNLKKKNE